MLAFRQSIKPFLAASRPTGPAIHSASEFLVMSGFYCVLCHLAQRFVTPPVSLIAIGNHIAQHHSEICSDHVVRNEVSVAGPSRIHAALPDTEQPPPLRVRRHSHVRISLDHLPWCPDRLSLKPLKPL